jgi:tetratricopeptide (TPR) repeat protein
VRAVFGLGRSSLLSKNYQQADVALRRTLEWAPTHLPIYVEAHYALALTQIQLKNYEEAKTLFKKVLELDPDYPQAETKLARLEASF